MRKLLLYLTLSSAALTVAQVSSKLQTKVDQQAKAIDPKIIEAAATCTNTPNYPIAK